MSRSNETEYYEEKEHDNGINKVIDDFSIKENKIVLIDADSLVYWCLYNKTEDGITIIPTEDDLDNLKGKLRESVLKIFNAVEEYYTIRTSLLFIRGKNNFRKKLCTKYKANRPAPNPLIVPLYQCLVDEFDAIESDNYEAEDYLYTAHTVLGDNNCIVCFIDHDLEEIEGLLYNYKKNFWKIQDRESARHELCKKLIISEVSDHVNFCPGIGKKYFEKNFYKGMSNFSYLKAVYIAYLKAYKGDVKKTRDNLKMAWDILKLQIVKNEQK